MTAKCKWQGGVLEVWTGKNGDAMQASQVFWSTCFGQKERHAKAKVKNEGVGAAGSWFVARQVSGNFSTAVAAVWWWPAILQAMQGQAWQNASEVIVLGQKDTKWPIAKSNKMDE